MQLELTTIDQALRELRPGARRRLPGDQLLGIRAAVSANLATLLEPHAGRIVLEITEHEAVEDYGALVQALAPLREMGARIAIDDAGAGFASLRHTLQITPDIVKMDISLTRGIDTDRAKRALAAALISFAEEMDIVDGGRRHRDGGGARRRCSELGRPLRSGLLSGRTRPAGPEPCASGRDRVF